jgi:hypothetical protein
MKIITVAFGKDMRISQLLFVFLHSIYKNIAACEVLLYYYNLPENTLRDIRLAFPKCLLIEEKITINPRHLTSQKTYFWHKAMHHLTVNDNIAFLDSDMLVHKDFTEVFSSDFEVGYLEKDFDSLFRLNGGSIFVKDIEKGKVFFDQWLAECNKYAGCGDHEKEEIENNYGGLDQYALYKTINLLSPSIKLKNLPATVYNLHGDWSRFDPEKTCIVHYKSSWYKLLFDHDTSYIRLLSKYGWEWEGCEKWEAVWLLWRQYYAQWIDFIFSLRKLEVLYLCNYNTYASKMSRVRFQSMEAIGKICNVIWSGKGWDNYKDDLTVEENIARLYGDVRPDVVVAYKPLGLKEFNKIKLPKIIRYNEMWDIDWTTSEILKSGANIVIAHHKNDLEKYRHIDNVYFAHIAHCAESLIYRDYKEKKTVDILLTGSLDEYHYPFRVRMKRLIEQHLSKIFICEILKHSTLVLDGYARKINSAKITVTCSSRWRYRLGKYSEIPLCGSLLCADLPAEDEDFFKSFMLVIDDSMSDSEIIEKISYYVTHDQEREALVLKGMQATQIHTQQHYAEHFLKTVVDALRSRIDFEQTKYSPHPRLISKIKNKFKKLIHSLRKGVYYDS